MEKLLLVTANTNTPIPNDRDRFAATVQHIKEVNELLDQGWSVKSLTPVSAGGAYTGTLCSFLALLHRVNS